MALDLHQSAAAALNKPVTSAHVNEVSPTAAASEGDEHALEIRDARKDAAAEYDSQRKLIFDLLSQHFADAPGAPASRECPQPLASLKKWVDMAFPYSLWFRGRGKMNLEEPYAVLGEALVHAPILPPMLLEALIRPAWALNDWIEFDEGHWRNVRGLENALPAGDRKELTSKNGYVDPTTLTASEAAFLQPLLGMSRRLSWASAAFIASQFNCRNGFPSLWANRGWDQAEEQITRIFRRFQRRLIDAESRWGNRAVVREEALRTSFSVEELPPSKEAISVRWAIEQVLSDDPWGELEPDWRRARNFGRLTSLMLDRGMVSLAGAFHCFFAITQGFIVVGKAARLPQRNDQQESVDLVFVDDWALFAANTHRLQESAWGERLERSLRLTTLALRNAACADRLAFEARQLSAFLPEDTAEATHDDEVVDDVVHLATASPEYAVIESRLQEAMGNAFRDLPSWVREALKSAERQFEVGMADREVMHKHDSNPWAMEYAKIVERLLREGLAILWSDPALKTESESLYGEQSSSRRFPQSFAMGAALSVLAAAKRARPRGVISDRLDRAGIDSFLLSGELGDEIGKVVSRVRNKEAHGTAPLEEAKELRLLVLKNLPRLFVALGRPKG